ncbi:pseudouridine synthase [Paracoccus marinus]|uniref:pseudouridine synthase n=1 Tax=Paracoccus marinus TaxID=288426 RepID=UPI001C8F7888
MTDQNDQTGTPDEPQQDDLPTATDDGTEALSDAQPVAADEDYAEIYAGEDAGADDAAAVDEREGGDNEVPAEEPGDETGDEPAQSPAATPGEPPASAPKSSGGERIAKVMARAGIASRREAERMIVEGRVRVNGDAITSPALDILPTDKVVVDGKPMDAPQETRMWLYYKPVGLVTSESDEKGRQTVFEALPRDLPRVMSVGRLDITSEGLLLLTNDGELKRRLELPATGWLRRYRVRVNGNPSELTFDPLRRGATIDGEEFQPMEVKLDSQKGANAWLTVGIREGRNREIRRAMAHVGLQVNRLIRIAYGPFRLVGMEENEVREVKRRILKDQLGGLLTGDSDEEPRAATRGRRDDDRGARPARGDRPERGNRGDRGERASRGHRPAFDNRDGDGPRKPRAPRAEGGGGYDRKPREGAGGFDRKPRGESPGGYDRKPRAEGAGGGFDRKPRTEGAGGYDRKPRGEGAGGYERKPRAEGAGGGYERKPRDGAGGYSRGPRPEGAGGDDRKPRAEGGAGGYDRKPRAEGGAGAFDRKPRSVGEQGDQPRKPRWKASEGGDRGAGGQGRPRAEGQGDSRPPRAAGGERGKPAYGDRPGFGGKPAADRPSAGKPYGGKPGGGGRGKPFGGKPGDERPGGKPAVGKPGGGRPGGKPFGGKPGGARPAGRGPRPGGAPTGPRGPGGGSRER